MITKRIIPCLDVKDGRVVKGVNFAGLQDLADPVEMARYYNAAGADELVFYDITASVEGRTIFTDILRRVASEIFIPLTVGGGIGSLEDFDRVLKCGADKVSVNSGAIKNPAIISAAAQRYGNQCVVLSADIKRVDGKFKLFTKGGRENTGIDALDWLEHGVKNGAGELVVNSIDTDGVKNGFDLELLINVFTDPFLGYFRNRYIFGQEADLASTVAKITSGVTLINSLLSTVCAVVLFLALVPALRKANLLPAADKPE